MYAIEALLARASGQCELCASTDDLGAWPVPPAGPGDDRAVCVCAACRAQLDGAALDPRHWRVLQQSAWSEVPAVQVVAWRLLGRIGEPWAIELRDQLYLDEDTQLWAREGEADDEVDVAIRTVDSNGAPLAEGDTVTLIKDLDVKGAAFTAKRGTVVKNIHLTDDPGLVEGRVGGTTIVLKTMFLKKSG